MSTPLRPAAAYLTRASITSSLKVELRRLTRSGLGLGVLVGFTFFGLSGPVLSIYMPEILGAAASTDQLAISASQATPADAISLFNQSAMQLGLIVTVAVAITSIGWDTRPGSSIFYRTRVHRLSTVLLPRLIIDWLIALATYSCGLLLAVVVTASAIGHPPAGMVIRTWMACGLYIVMAMRTLPTAHSPVTTSAAITGIACSPVGRSSAVGTQRDVPGTWFITGRTRTRSVVRAIAVVVRRRLAAIRWPILIAMTM